MNDEIEIILQPSEVEVTTPLVADYVLPKATATVLGGVKIGANVNVSSDGTISIPTASANTGGVVKVGNNLSIDENGVLSASTDYTLPQATKTTLGGVYVDDALDDSSLNPVQNSVVTTNIATISNDVENLSDSLDTANDNISTLTSNISTISDSVSSLSTNVSTNSNAISTINSEISTIGNNITTINTTLTGHGNSIDALSGLVNSLSEVISETYTYQDIDDTIWTAGEIDIRGKGFYAVMYINLDGSLIIPSGSSVTLFTLPQDYIPAYDAYGGADIVDGSISVKIDSATGAITLINNNTSSMNIGKLNASIPIIYGSI